MIIIEYSKRNWGQTQNQITIILTHCFDWDTDGKIVKNCKEEEHF